MEPDDLPFLEISGEDDSLLSLQKIPSDDVSSLSKTYFTCSPLQIPRSNRSVNPPPLLSPVAGMTGNEDEEKLNSSLNRDSVNKENVSMNKPEVQKLSVEPQQMKRKKKGGGYNLRKSLAWDRAFFTEEGVLNPLELSMISGNFGKSSGEMSVIHEDGKESLAGDSGDLTVLEENLFKELPASTRKKDIRVGPTSLPKNSPSASVAKRKVLSAHDINRSGSKRSGCPRPVASSSLKRPANVNTTKAATKELNVSKIPVRRPDPSVHPVTAKSNIQGVSNSKRVSSSKQNPIALPAASVQRNIGLKCSSTSFKSARSDARSSSDSSRSVVVKSSIQQARRNVASSALEIHSSTNTRHPLIAKANNASKINPAPALRASGHPSNIYDGDSSNVAIPLPPNVPCGDGTMQYAQLHAAKPSGLRMPSPSLGFFNQSKASASHSISQRSNQVFNVPESNVVPHLRKFGPLNGIHERPVHATAKIPDLVKGMTASTNMRIPDSITESSVPPNLNPESHEKMKSNLLMDDIRKEEVNEPSNSNCYDVLHNQQRLHSSCNDVGQQSLQNAEPSQNAKISRTVDNELLSSDNKLQSECAPCDQLKKDGADGRVADVYPASVDLNAPQLENPHITSPLQLAVQVEGVSETKDIADNQFEEDKMSNSLSKDLGASLDSQTGDANDASSKSQSRYANRHCIKGPLRKSDDWLSSVHDIDEQSRKQAEEMILCTREVDQIYSESQRPWMSSGTFSPENRSSLEFQKCISTNTADSSQEDRCCVGDELKSSHGPSHSRNIEEAQDGILFTSALDDMAVDDVNEIVIDANGSDSKSSSALCSIPSMQNGGFDTAMIVECPHGDETLSDFVDTRFRCDIKPHGQSTSGISKMMDKDQVRDFVAAGDIEGPNVCPNGGCELENSPCMTSQPSSAVQVKVGSEENDTMAAMQVKVGSAINDINEHKYLEDGEYNLLVNNHHTDSDLQRGDDISYCQQSTSTVDNYQLSYMHVVSKQSVEGNQISEVHDELPFEEGMPCEEPKEFNIGKVAVVSPSAKNFGGSEMESPHDLFQDEYTKQAHEEGSAVDNRIEKLLVEDAQMQVLDRSLSVDGHKCNLNASTVKNKSSVVVNDAMYALEDATVSSTSKNDTMAAMQVKVGSAINDINEHKDVEDGEYNLSVNNHHTDSDLQHGDDISYCQQSTSTVDNYQLSYMHVVHKQSVKGNQISEVHDELLFEEGMPCEESKEFSIGEVAVVGLCAKSFGGSEMENPRDLFQDEYIEEGSIVDNRIENLLVEDAQMQVLDRSLPVDGYKCNLNASTVKNKSSVVVDDAMYALEDATVSSTGSVVQVVNINALNSDVLPEEAETITSQKNGCPNSEMRHELEGAICATKDKDPTKSLKKSETDKQQENLVIKPPPHAVPFSDEWLAAFESAGEEILTLKRGAVQNSPPDKSQPEPGPWSPVKRKNNQGIGPYDCTKFTNPNVPSSSSSSSS